MPMMARQLGSIHAAIIKDTELLFNDYKIIKYLTLKNFGFVFSKNLPKYRSMKQAE